MEMSMRLVADGHQLEYAGYGPPTDKAPTLVFLHEGLGCVSTWRDFPARVAEATGCGALVYSRAGFPELALSHAVLTGVASLIAILIGTSAGIFATRPAGRAYAATLEMLTAVAQTFPPVAVLALAVPAMGYGAVEPFGILNDPDGLRADLDAAGLFACSVHAAPTGEDAEAVEWSCYWLVQCHWRRQWHPSVGEHPPMYIDPHLKGDFEKPFRQPRQKLYVVAR